VGRSEFCYAGNVEIPVSIALFFLLSGLFLFALLAALQRSKKAGIVAGVCLVAVVLIIVLVTPVQLWTGDGDDTASDTTTTVPQVASSDTTDSSVGGTESTDTTSTTLSTSTSTSATSTTSSSTASTTSTSLAITGSGWQETFELEALW